MIRVALLFCLTQAAWSQCNAGAEKTLALADSALHKGDLEHAEEIAKGVRVQFPGCSQAVLLLGIVQGARGMHEAARDSLTGYTQLEPRDSRGFEALAQQLAQLQDSAAAAQAARHAVTLSPDSMDALLIEGEILGREGRQYDAEAQDAFEKACRIAPRNPAPYFRLGLFFDSRGRHSEAIKSFRETLVRDRENATVWEYLALNLEQLGQPDEAEAAYKKGLTVNVGARLDPSLPYHYGKLLLNRNRLAESETYLDRAAALTPDNGAILFQRARLYVRMGKYANARLDAERVLALPDRLRFTYEIQLDYLLATIYGRLGETQLAAKFAELARLARAPEAGEVR